MGKREKAPLFAILLLYALAIGLFIYLGMNNGSTRNLSYEKLYNKYIVYRIDFPGDTFDEERDFALRSWAVRSRQQCPTCPTCL